MPTYNSREMRAFHRPRGRGRSVFIGILIPIVVASIIGGVTAAKSAWHGVISAKADTLAVNAKADTLAGRINAIKDQLTRIETKTDDAVLRLRQIKCGVHINDGCR